MPGPFVLAFRSPRVYLSSKSEHYQANRYTPALLFFGLPLAVTLMDYTGVCAKHGR